MAVCPTCGSLRVRNGYRPVPLPLRIFGIRELLCDNCNYLYRAFSPLPPKKPQRHHERKAEVFAPHGAVNLESLKQPASATIPVEQHPPHRIPLPTRIDPVPSACSGDRHSHRTCPKCGSHDIKRRHRRRWERVFFAFSDKRAYLCNECDASLYL